MTKIPDVSEWNTGIPPDRSGVYAFLAPDDELSSNVLYAGSTENLRRRLYTHKVSPWFYYAFGLKRRKEPAFAWLQLDDDLQTIERETIDKLRPPLNKRLPRGELLRQQPASALNLRLRITDALSVPMKRQALCTLLGVNYRAIDNALHKLKLAGRIKQHSRGLWIAA